MGKKKRMGRPPLGVKPMDEVIKVRVTKADRKRLAAEAKRQGVGLAAYIRAKLFEQEKE